MLNPFRQDSYTTHRPMITDSWVDMMRTDLQLKYPEVPVERIDAYLKNCIASSLVVPMVDVLHHPSPGNTIRETIPLTKHLGRDVNQNIVAPSGSVYVTPDKKESFLRISLATKVSERGKYKHIMLDAKEKGDVLRTLTYHYLQASTKVFVNSAPGAMNSPLNILYDKPGFNSITSISRMSVKYGYAHTERLVEGNLYLPGMEDTY